MKSYGLMDGNAVCKVCIVILSSSLPSVLLPLSVELVVPSYQLQVRREYLGYPT
jgi:hypothetical protein